MAIVGGALVPMLMGWIADVASMRIGMVVPFVCFVLVGLYATVWQKLEKSDAVA
jgi:FHS family L-fucose permease-like MFS transporter